MDNSELKDLLIDKLDNFDKMLDIFVKKSVSSTILTLAKSLLNIYKRKNKIKTIGFRHGEKLFETLLSKEEKYVQKKEINKSLEFLSSMGARTFDWIMCLYSSSGVLK